MSLNRREFVQLVALGTGALVFGVRLGDAEDEAVLFRPNAWVRIEPDGRIVIVVGKQEMGQGVRTSMPMIVAEELDVELSQVVLEQASTGPDYPSLGTGGSSSTMRSWKPLRMAGAAAREMLVAAAALRWGVDASTCRTSKGRVFDGQGRSLGYGELAAEAARVDVPAAPRLKERSAFTVVGRSHDRIDGPDIVTGRARYGLDVRLQGMVYAVLQRSPVLGGTVASFDDTRALAVPGVLRCLKIHNGVAVVARSTWAAIRGREALAVAWNPSPHAEFSSAVHRRNMTDIVRQPGVTTRRDGAGAAALAQASRRHEAIYMYPFEAHAAVEPVCATAWVRDGRCDIWSPTQDPNSVQHVVAQVLEMPRANVTSHPTLLGGGFGRRLGWDFEVEAAAIARSLDVPVQLVWTREDDMRHGYFQAASAHRLEAGIDAAGRVVAWTHRKASTPHNARGRPTPEELRDPDELRSNEWGVYDTPYAIPALETAYAVVEAPVPIGPWRAVFSPSSVFARECFFDEVSQLLERDPLELRLELLGARDPAIERVVTPGGERIDRQRLRRVLEVVTDKAGWGDALPEGRARGLACNVFHTETYIAYVVEVSTRVRPHADLPFTIERVVCALDCGVVVNPLGVEQQVESGIVWAISNMKTAITFRDGGAEQGNFLDFPVANIAETPDRIEVHIVDDGTDENPHGLGEPVVCPLAPAAVNALSRLTGKRIRELPIRAADVG